MIKFELNGKAMELDVDPEMPLLWALRDELQLTGTKYGCGMTFCGACTVQVDGQAVRACMYPVSGAMGKKITTIEGVAQNKIGKIVQEAWIKLDVAQCGYCQPGQIISAISLLSSNRKPSDADIDSAMSGNICRCGTYSKIRAAVHLAAKSLG